MKYAIFLAFALFAGFGLLLLSYPGVQYDEVLFISAINGHGGVEYAMKFGSHNVPIMLMTYIGTLKAAIYAPLLHWFTPNEMLLRLPVLIIGLFSIALFFLAVRRLTTPAIATLVSLLLATDTLYLLTCVFDWGPVALQHLLGLGALYCLVRYVQDDDRRWLFAGTLCIGLALWDKALFVWLMAGFGVATLVVYPKELLRITRRHWAVALLGFVLGAAPFLYYNKIHRLRTFTANTEMDPQGPAAKFGVIQRTLDGAALFGYLASEDPRGPVQDLKDWERIPLSINAALGDPRESLQRYLLYTALLLGPLVCWFGPHRRLAIFFLLGSVLTYLQMTLTRNSGGSAHHSVLLWPLPQILLALLLSQVALRWPRRGLLIASAVVIVAVGSNVIILNSYLAHFISGGAGPMWSDAIHPLYREVANKPGRTVFVVDWGIAQQLDYFSKGRLASRGDSDGVVVALPDPGSVVNLEKNLADPSILFLTHTEDHEAFAGVRKKLLDFAAERGYHHSLLQTIQDRHGAAIFEIHEFRK